MPPTRKKEANLVLLDRSENAPDENLINLLTDMLESAKKGKILAVSLVYETTDRMHRIVEGDPHTAEHIMGLEQLKNTLIKQEEENEDV